MESLNNAAKLSENVCVEIEETAAVNHNQKDNAGEDGVARRGTLWIDL